MLRFLTTAWRRWLRFAEVLGNIQLTVILSLLYWILLPFWAFPYKMFNDRLALRNPGKVHWIRRIPGTDWLSDMKKQG